MSTEENKRVVRRYFEEFHNKRALSIASEIFADGGGRAVEMTRMMTAAFPDYQINVLDQVAEGDKVATVWTAQGTHRGTWMSPLGAIPASGRTVNWSGTTTLAMQDGKIGDVIGTNWDHLGILQQMGTLEAVAPRPGA